MSTTITDAARYRWMRACWLDGVEAGEDSAMQDVIADVRTAAEMDAAIAAELRKPENAHLLGARAGDGKTLTAPAGWQIKRDRDWIYFRRPDGWTQAVTSQEPQHAHSQTLFMLLDAMLAAAPAVSAPAPLTWYDGPPPFPQDQEWFIAETIYGDRVALIALEEGRRKSMDWEFKTADGTYLKRASVKRWMQFPDCEYLPPAAPVQAPVTVAAIKPVAESSDDDDADEDVQMLMDRDMGDS